MSDAGDITKKDFAVKLRLIREVDYSRTIDSTLDFRYAKNVAEFLQPLQDLVHEVMVVLFLNRHGHCLGTLEYNNGDEQGVRINPRAVCAAAILSGAEKVVLAHNHPSHVIEGNCIFSKTDLDAAEGLTLWLKIFGIEFSDSVLISGKCFTSMEMQRVEKKKTEEQDPYQRGDFLPTKEYILDDDKPLTREELLLDGVNVEDRQPPEGEKIHAMGTRLHIA